MVPPLQPRALVDVDGTWAWTNTSSADGVTRTESERWSLAGEKETVRGHYIRRVTFSHDAAMPFVCSQSPSFTLETRYEVTGVRDVDAANIAEVTATAVPSPCSPGSRPLSSYKAMRDGDRLVVSGKLGEQSLAADETGGATPAPATPAPTVGGAWKWETKSTGDDGIVRVEKEVWQLSLEGEIIAGTYKRTVTLTAPVGTLPCANAEAGAKEVSVSLVDDYVLGGWVTADGIEISEQAVTPSTHACAVSQKRHLDVAKGRLYRDHLELRWRAERRQVLSRP